MRAEASAPRQSPVRRLRIRGDRLQAAAFWRVTKNLQATGVPQPDAWEAIREQLEAHDFQDVVDKAPGDQETLSSN